MGITRAYEEVVEFIAAGVSSDDVAAFRRSEAARQRVGELVEREKTDGLSAEERSELENYLQLEHIMRLAKARARRYISLK
jgi:hypothetical protein